MTQILDDDLGAPVAEEPTRSIAAEVRKALAPNTHLEPDDIRVASTGTEITLTGTVRSWAESNQACHLVWAVPGVTSVVNLLRVV